eukprot:Skav230187  [mRNA]  locus=scaffold1418:21835:35724:- [translate_table: standard]
MLLPTAAPLCALRVPFDAPNIPGLVQKITKAPVPTVPATYSTPQLQGIVRQMLDEAQEAVQAVDDGGIHGGMRRIHSESDSIPAAPVPPSGSSVGEPCISGYKANDLVEYYSVSHGDWLPATVVKTDSEGRIIDQAKKVRRRKESASRAGSRAGSPMRPGSRPGSRGPSLGDSPLRAGGAVACGYLP